ncbi:MAG: AsmA-like C-terminal region-containing protein [Robiginitomaculum sp.]|nr:AsmA-like C-terminal region-containing protein [Robiginitomaculum sp.]MDQ7078373.1 AsmA-like C-terminal region-containing protein [Robiginitomaculum sp.]
MTEPSQQSQQAGKATPADDQNQRIWRATLMHGLEVVALLLALAMAVSGGVAWRLAQGPVSLEFLRKDAERSLVQVFEGGEAHIGALQAIWSPKERAIVIAAREVRVVDNAGRVLVQVPQFDVGLSALGLLQGKAILQRIIAIGGEFSIVRKEDGRIGAGLGQPDQVVFATPAKQARENANKNNSRASLPDVLKRLRVLAMRDASLHFVDERSGVNWTAPHANLRFVRNGNQIVASAFGNIESPSGTTHISINASSRSDFSRMNAELSLNNAVPATLLPLSKGGWQWLGGVDAPLNAQISFATTEEGLLRSADGHLRFTQGVYRKGESVTPIESAEIVFAFDPIDGAVSIELAEIHSKLVSGTLKGHISGLDPARLVVGKKIGFDLSFENIAIEPDNVFDGALQVNRLWMDGHYLPGEKKAEFKHLGIGLYDLSLQGAGALTLPDTTLDTDAPLFTLKARSDGQITPAQILSLWPVNFAKGGRDWIHRNVLSGRLHDLVLDVRLPQRAIGAHHLDNDMLSLSFAFDEADAHFVNAMTPLRAGEGTGLLQGNRFDLRMNRAQLRGLILKDGFVEIPRLSPKGVTARFGGRATGPLGDVVKLLDEPPLGFISKYGLSTDAITGQGEMEFTIARPMRVQVAPRKIGFAASGDFKDIRVVGLIAGQDLAGVSAKFTASPDGMRVEGDGKLGSVPGHFIWQEKFFPKDEPRTRLEIDVVTNEQVFDDLGIPTRLFVDGPMGIHVTTEGEGKKIVRARLQADLTQARLMSPGEEWEKPTGQPGKAELLLTRRADGGYEIEDFEASTEGFLLAGDLSIAAKGGVQSAHIAKAKMAGLFDFSADINRSDDGAFLLKGHAKELDARGFVRGLTQGGNNDFGFALDANVTFDQAMVSDDMTLVDGVLDFKRSDQDIETLIFRASTPHGKASFSIRPDDTGMRQVSGQSDDAGLVIQALFGASSVHGGVIQINGTLGDGKDTHTRLDLSMSDFKLRNVPVMARMLSLGSLTGIANTMSGEGIGFKTLIAPLEFDEGKIYIGEARATGPALGVTVTGTINMAEKSMDLSGALAPAYSLNSALGNIPVLGGVLVSRKGEGLFGLSYQVKGPFEALQVFVNPLSALTPGVLRRIFEGGKVNVEPRQAPEPKSEQTVGQKVPAPVPEPESTAQPVTEPAQSSDGG